MASARLYLGLALFGFSALAATAPRKLIWSDDFSGPPGSKPDPSKWTYDLGSGGWGNQELETYTNAQENAFLDGDGHLVIRAIKAHRPPDAAPDKRGPSADLAARAGSPLGNVVRGSSEDPAGHFTSARLKTQGLFSFTYGHVEARMQLPRSQGMWPAFWMLGSDIEKSAWPGCGEVDIMESLGREPAIVHGTIHGPGYSGQHAISAQYSLPGAPALAAGFHTYAVDWMPGRIDFSIDGHTYSTVQPASIPPGTKWVFDHPFFILLNLAVGGAWPGNPDASTRFPQQLVVDYVRVYQSFLLRHSPAVYTHSQAH